MKTAVIHSYFVNKPGVNAIAMPAGATILGVLPSSKGLRINAWHIEGAADEKLVTETRYFYTARTGLALPAAAFQEGTVLHSFRGGLHLMEVTDAAAAVIAEMYPVVDEADADMVLTPGEG